MEHTDLYQRNFVFQNSLLRKLVTALHLGERSQERHKTPLRINSEINEYSENYLSQKYKQEFSLLSLLRRCKKPIVDNDDNWNLFDGHNFPINKIVRIHRASKSNVPCARLNYSIRRRESREPSKLPNLNASLPEYDSIKPIIKIPRNLLTPTNMKKEIRKKTENGKPIFMIRQRKKHYRVPDCALTISKDLSDKFANISLNCKTNCSTMTKDSSN